MKRSSRAEGRKAWPLKAKAKQGQSTGWPMTNDEEREKCGLNIKEEFQQTQI